MTRYEDDGIHFEIDSPFCSVKTTISARRTKSLEDWEGQQFAFVEKVGRPQISASRIDRNGVGNLCSNLLLLEARNLFALVSPDMNVPCIFRGVLQRHVSQTNMANVRWPPFASPLFRPLAGRGGFLRVMMGSTQCAHFNSQPDHSCMMQHFAHGGSFT